MTSPTPGDTPQRPRPKPAPAPTHAPTPSHAPTPAPSPAPSRPRTAVPPPLPDEYPAPLPPQPPIISAPPAFHAPPQAAPSYAPLAAEPEPQPESILITRWLPPSNIRTHANQPIPQDALFFQPPPEEIGKILSAETSISLSKRPHYQRNQIILYTFAGITLFLFIVFAILTRSPIGALICPAFFGTIFYCIFALFFRRKITCSYVGTRGAVRYRYRGPKKFPDQERVVFAEAANLRAGGVRQFINGIYSGTTYNFTWTDPAGRRLLHIRGSHRGNDKLPKPKDPFHFPRAAERAWSNFAVNRAADELAETGAVLFTLSPAKSIHIGPGFIDFHWGPTTQRFLASDIGKLDLSNGTFRIHHKDARWFSLAGKYTFSYAQLPNARLFLLTLERFIHIT